MTRFCCAKDLSLKPSMTNLRMLHNLYIQVIAQLNPVTIIDKSHNFDGSLNVTSLLGKVKPGSQVG